MENVAGVLIIAAGVFLAIVGLRGTQGTVFPGLFSASSSSSSSPPPEPAAPEGSYTFPQLQQLAQQAGFTHAQSMIAAAVAMAESGGNPNATGPYGERGLWQIYPAAHPDLAQQYNLFDPVQNAIAALQVFKEQGWNAWTTYVNGAYHKFLTGHTT